jgi:hypothetical protein
VPRKPRKAPPPEREHFNLLPIVKAYPVVDPKSGEAVCVAALTTDVPRRWIRLFPLDFRNLDFSQQFRKYQHISVDAFKAKGDHRPESYTPILDSIKLGTSIGTDNGKWSRRVELCEPLLLLSMCELQRRQAADETSLGMFRPAKVHDIVVEPATGLTGKQEATLDQGSLFNRTTGKLETIPWKFKYVYRCVDKDCPTHRQSIIDWELGALYLKLRNASATEDQIRAKIRARFLNDLCGPDRDPIFIAGNLAKYPASFMILGVVYPKRGPVQKSLF